MLCSAQHARLSVWNLASQNSNFTASTPVKRLLIPLKMSIMSSLTALSKLCQEADLFDSSVVSIGHFLDQPDCNHVAKSSSSEHPSMLYRMKSAERSPAGPVVTKDISSDEPLQQGRNRSRELNFSPKKLASKGMPGHGTPSQDVLRMSERW